MKIVKLKNTEFSNLESLLKRVQLISERGNDKIAHPDRIYVNKKTYSAIKKATLNEFKKEYPYLSKKELIYSTEMYLLNLGPNRLEIGGMALPYGYAIVLPLPDDGVDDSEKIPIRL